MEKVILPYLPYQKRIMAYRRAQVKKVWMVFAFVAILCMVVFAAGCGNIEPEIVEDKNMVISSSAVNPLCFRKRK